jgi:DNA-binding CsgD family transcriptional regulator
VAQGCFADADAAFLEALSHHERLDWPHQYARTLLGYGSLLRRTNHRREARARLDAALAIFERNGEPLWAAQVREQLARLGGRTPMGEMLTDAERRVVELVAAGRTNRDVASILSISVRTVEATLTRAYAKLDVRSRAQLAARWPATAERARR